MNSIIAWLAFAPLALEGGALSETPDDSAGVRFSWGHMDGDSLAEALVVNAAGEVRLLRNDGNGNLFDQTLGSGLESLSQIVSAGWADFDADGRDDCLFIQMDGTARLFRNVSGYSFVEVGVESGLEFEEWLNAAWFDYDADGRLDLLVTGSGGDTLYHNEQGRFRVAHMGASNASPSAVIGSLPLPPLLPRGTAQSLEDAAIPGNCIPASSVPVMGALLPLSDEWSIDQFGQMGIGVNEFMSSSKLDVNGVIRTRSGGLEFPDGTVLTSRLDQGSVGPAGSSGPPGVTGAQGPQGATGATGPDGPQGAIGPQGATGPQGNSGPQGGNGADGADGMDGPGFYGTQTLLINAASFLGADTNQNVLRFQGGNSNSRLGAYRTSGSNPLIAAVHLPDGARIEAIRFSGFKGSVLPNMILSFRQAPHTSTTDSELMQVFNSAPGIGNFSVSASLNHTVSAAVNAYYVRVTPFNAPWSTQMAVHTVEVDYRVD